MAKIVAIVCIILLMLIIDVIVICIFKRALLKKYMDDNKLTVNIKCMKCEKIINIPMSLFAKGFMYKRYSLGKINPDESVNNKIIYKIKNRNVVIWKKKYCSTCKMKTKHELKDGYEFEKKLYGYKLKSGMAALGIFFISIFLIILPVVYLITWSFTAK